MAPGSVWVTSAVVTLIAVLTLIAVTTLSAIMTLNSSALMSLALSTVMTSSAVMIVTHSAGTAMIVFSTPAVLTSISTTYGITGRPASAPPWSPRSPHTGRCWRVWPRLQSWKCWWHITEKSPGMTQQQQWSMDQLHILMKQNWHWEDPWLQPGVQ